MNFLSLVLSNFPLKFQRISCQSQVNMLLILIFYIVHILFHCVLISIYTKTVVIHYAAVLDMRKNAHAALCSVIVHLYMCLLYFVSLMTDRSDRNMLDIIKYKIT